MVITIQLREGQSEAVTTVVKSISEMEQAMQLTLPAKVEALRESLGVMVKCMVKDAGQNPEDFSNYDFKQGENGLVSLVLQEKEKPSGTDMG